MTIIVHTSDGQNASQQLALKVITCLLGKFHVTCLLFITVSAEPEDEEDDTSDIQIKSLEEIKAEKARKALNTRGRTITTTLNLCLLPSKTSSKIY